MEAKKSKGPKRPKSPSVYVFDVFKDVAKKWRWRLWAQNGKIIAASESYSRKCDAIKTCDALACDLCVHTSIFVEGVLLEADSEPAPVFMAPVATHPGQAAAEEAACAC